MDVGLESNHQRADCTLNGGQTFQCVGLSRYWKNVSLGFFKEFVVLPEIFNVGFSDLGFPPPFFIYLCEAQIHFFLHVVTHCTAIVSSPSHFVIVLKVPNPTDNPINLTTAITLLVELSWTAVICFLSVVKVFDRDI